MEGPGGEKRGYPLAAASYKLLEEIGQGVSAVVYRAKCLPTNEVVAVKSLDLEKCTSNLDEIRREAQTMSLISHPNVVKAHCSFVVDQALWVVMPFLAGGSCLHVMKAAYPDGFEEPIIATVLKECLKALDYLHKHGHIHRDVKAGNILLDGNGTVKLGDFGVSACMFDTGDRQRSRNTFVGTPCWMAPEVMEQVHGYDFRADIWSFGITALELAHGHAPFSKYPPMKVLLMTLQNAPPGLDYERDKRFSKSFKEMIAMCLVKDPARRPSAEKLLKHSFFKNARSYEYVARHILEGLPPLGERVKNLKLKDATRLAQKKMPYGEQQERSQDEYKRGVSCWNFDVEDLKAEAAVLRDDACPVVTREENGETNHHPRKDRADPLSNAHTETPIYGQQHAFCPNHDSLQVRVANHLVKADTPADVSDRVLKEDTGPSSTSRHRGRFDFVEDGGNTSSDRADVTRESDLSRDVGKDQSSRRDDRENHQRFDDREKRDGKEHRKSDLKELDPGVRFFDRTVSSSRSREDDKDTDRDHRQVGRVADDVVFRSNNPKVDRIGPATAERVVSDHLPVNGVLPMSRSSSTLKDGVEEKSRGPLVQRKGRFSVTSENVESVENASLHRSPSVGDWSSERRHVAPTQTSSLSTVPGSMTPVPTATLVPFLQNILHQIAIQQDLVVNLMGNLSPAADTSKVPRSGSGGSKTLSRTASAVNADSRVEVASDRDQDQRLHAAELQSKIANLNDELQVSKLRNSQLEHQVQLASRSFAGLKDGVEEKSKGSLVQRKGRFSVTSGDGEGASLHRSGSVSDSSSERRQATLSHSTSLSASPAHNWITAVPAATILPHLQIVVQQATVQQEALVSLICSINTPDFCQRSGVAGSKNISRTAGIGTADPVVELASDKDRDMQKHVSELQSKIANLVDELQVMKPENIQLEHQLKALCSKEDERIHKEEPSRGNV